jgi:PPOX class probable F420-dependent enzyme
MTTTAFDTGLLDLIAGQNQGVLATIKADGRPQLSIVNYAFDRSAAVIKVSITATRAKYRNVVRDPRASLHVSSPDGWSYAVAEATSECSAVVADEHDATVTELIELFRDVQGEHPDWDDYRRAMVADQRVVLRLPISRVYGVSRQR